MLPPITANRPGMRGDFRSRPAPADRLVAARPVVYAQGGRSRACNRTGRAAVVNNDPELAVYLRRRFPQYAGRSTGSTISSCSRPFPAACTTQTPASPRWRLAPILARAVEHAYRMSPGRVQVSLNGVDATEFSVRDRPDRTPVVGFLGRIAIEKGADILLDAAALLADRGLHFALRIVGDTNWGEHISNPYVERVERRISALRARVIVEPPQVIVGRPDLPAALGASDIHVLPSRWDEPFGLALLEGMASGMPVMASATGGSPEVLGGSGSSSLAKTRRRSPEPSSRC